MARAVTLGTTMRNGAAAARIMVLAGLAFAACAGGGKDRDFSLPSGDELDTVRSDKALVVVEAHNECTRDGSCVPVDPTPCHLGSGNTRGLAVYRLGATGLLFASSSAGATPEQIVATDDNPRRVIAHPMDPRVLYVATRERVQVIRLRTGGGSACIDETLRDEDVRPDADDNDPVDMVIDPTIGNGILYVAGRGSNRIDAYPIAEDGTLPPLPTSCIVGGSNGEYAALTPLGENFFAAGGAVRIEVHPRVLGQFLPEPDPNATATPVPVPTASPSPDPEATPDPGATPGPGVPSPEPSTCVDARLVSTPLSAIGSAFVTSMFFEPSAREPLGVLFVAEEGSQRITTFPVDTDGVVDDDDTTGTKRAGVYQRMLRHEHPSGVLLYSTVFNEGRVDVFRLENGLLPDETFSRTAQDPNTLPVALAIDEPNGSILYVAQAGVHRVDGFRLRSDGGLPDEPATSTAPRLDADDRDLEPFPDDLVIVPLP